MLKGIQETQSLSDAKLLADLKKKKLATVTKVITYTVTKGPKYAKEMPVEHTDLTVELLSSGAWESANFKPYNFAALGASQDAGALHPLNKVRQEFRNIFFSQGFVEMPTGQSVRPIHDLFLPLITSASLTPASGTSTLSLYHSNIPHATCKTPSLYHTHQKPTSHA